MFYLPEKKDWTMLTSIHTALTDTYQRQTVTILLDMTSQTFHYPINPIQHI